MLDGSIATRNGQAVFQASDGVTVPLDKRQIGARQGDAETALSIMFRPQSVTIRKAGEGGPPGNVNLRGIVRHREFLGSLIRYSVAVGENMILVDDSHQRGEPAFAEGAEVSLCLASEQVVLLSE